MRQKRLKRAISAAILMLSAACVDYSDRDARNLAAFNEQRRAEESRHASANAVKILAMYYRCVIDYATSHEIQRFTATEIVEAARGSCMNLADDYQLANRIFYTLQYADSPAAIDARVQSAVDDARRTAGQFALRALADKQQNQ